MLSQEKVSSPQSDAHMSHAHTHTFIDVPFTVVSGVRTTTLFCARHVRTRIHQLIVIQWLDRGCPHRESLAIFSATDTRRDKLMFSCESDTIFMGVFSISVGSFVDAHSFCRYKDMFFSSHKILNGASYVFFFISIV